MSTYAVAGVTGRVGSVVAAELLKFGDEVKAIVRDESRGAAWRDRGAELAVGSLDDRAFLAKALAGSDGFFVLLPPNDTVAHDYYGTQRRMSEAIAAAVEQSGVPHVVMLSSLGADLPDGTGPIKSLHYLENILRTTGTRLTAIRACYFQENVSDVLPGAMQSGAYVNFLPSEDAAIPMIATRDIGRLAAEQSKSPARTSEIIDLVGPEYSARQLSDKIGALIGKPLQIVSIPVAGQLDALLQSGLPREVAESYVEMSEALASGILTCKGDRVVAGTTTIDEVLPGLLAQVQARGASPQG